MSIGDTSSTSASDWTPPRDKDGKIDWTAERPEGYVPTQEVIDEYVRDHTNADGNLEVEIP